MYYSFTAQLAQMLTDRLPGVSVYRYDGIAKDGLSAMEYFDGPVKVSSGMDDKQIDVIKTESFWMLSDKPKNRKL